MGYPPRNYYHYAMFSAIFQVFAMPGQAENREAKIVVPIELWRMILRRC